MNALHHGLGSETYAQQVEEPLKLGSEPGPEQEQEPEPEPEQEPELGSEPEAESGDLEVLAGVVVGQGNVTEDAPVNLMLQNITSSLAFWVANGPVTQQSRLCGLPECDRAELNLLLRMLADKVIAQVIPCQGCYFQRFEILIAHGVKGRRPLENQGFLSISSAKMHKKLS